MFSALGYIQFFFLDFVLALSSGSPEQSLGVPNLWFTQFLGGRRQTTLLPDRDAYLQGVMWGV